jgi:D-3-phosphoglycerate dehydrogenase
LKAIDLDGKTLGLVGTGRIGTQVAKKAQGAFNMQVIAYDPFVKSEVAAANGITLVSDLKQVFTEADVVTLHTPLTPQTRNLVNAELLAAMKPSAFLVNFASGEVVDEAALIAALVVDHHRSGRGRCPHRQAAPVYSTLKRWRSASSASEVT